MDNSSSQTCSMSCCILSGSALVGWRTRSSGDWVWLGATKTGLSMWLGISGMRDGNGAGETCSGRGILSVWVCRMSALQCTALYNPGSWNWLRFCIPVLVTTYDPYFCVVKHLCFPSQLTRLLFIYLFVLSNALESRHIKGTHIGCIRCSCGACCEPHVTPHCHLQMGM